jgi:hypothetical protein
VTASRPLPPSGGSPAAVVVASPAALIASVRPPPALVRAPVVPLVLVTEGPAVAFPPTGSIRVGGAICPSATAVGAAATRRARAALVARAVPR